MDIYTSVSYWTAFMAGLLSFLSPCVLPLIPAYFTFITGYSIEELTQDPNARIRYEVMLATVFFVAGFTLVFVLMGASASFLGGLISAYKDYIRIIGGILIILLGIHLTGIIRLSRLDIERRMHIKKKPLHLVGILIVGMAFGAGWSPCIGPLLGSILIMAGNKDTIGEGVALLAVYAAGLALPFLIISVFIPFLLGFMRRAKSALQYVNAVAGVLLIIVGGLLLTDSFALFSKL